MIVALPEHLHVYILSAIHQRLHMETSHKKQICSCINCDSKINENGGGFLLTHTQRFAHSDDLDSHSDDLGYTVRYSQADMVLQPSELLQLMHVIRVIF